MGLCDCVEVTPLPGTAQRPLPACGSGAALQSPGSWRPAVSPLTGDTMHGPKAALSFCLSR